MFCKYCGHSIDEDSIFCSNCGNNIKRKNEQDSGNTVSFQNIRENSQQVGEEQFLDFRQNSKTTEKRIPSSFNEIPILKVEDINDLYQKESEATFIGILVIIVSLILVIFKPFTFDTEQAYYEFLRYASIIAFVFRVVAVFWVASIAKRQGRNETAWGIFAFFLPAVALILIGQLKKLAKKITLDNFLDHRENSEELFKIAKNYFEVKNYKDSLRYAKKSVEIYSQNKDALNLLRKITLELPSGNYSNKEIQTVYRELKNGDIIKIISKNYQTIGAKVFVNNAFAQDNVYEYGNDDRKIFVKNGRIEKIQYHNNLE